MTTIENLSPNSLFRVDGEVAMVTGAGNGFGRIAALALSAAGAAVAVTDIDTDAAARVVGEIEEGGGNALAFHLDVADREAINRVVDEVARAFGGVHILINNAGTARRGPSEEVTDEDWDLVVAVNMTGPFACARAAARHMLEQRNGRIVNIASIMGFVGNDLFPHTAYQSTKGGLVNMTRSLAVEWGDRGIRVNAIAPTFFKTNFGQRLWQDPEMVRAIEERTPLGRFGEPEELAGGILYLASEASSMVTGHTLAIDGGWLAK